MLGVLAARLTRARTLNIDKIDVTVSSRIDGASYTAARAANLPNLDAAISSRMPGGTTVVPVVQPNLASFAAPVGNATAWTLGAWTQIVAAGVLTSHALAGVSWWFAGANAQLEIGAGGAGAEVVIARSASITFGVLSENQPFWFVPLVSIPANARLAVRVADDSGGASTHNVAVVCYPRPLG